MGQFTDVTTGEVRFSFVKIFQPADDGKYEITCILPKSDVETKAKIDAAIAEATRQGVAQKWGGVAPNVVQHPVYDGDGVRPKGEPFGPECKGCWVFKARSKTPPSVVNENRETIMVQSDVYSGAYGHVNFTVYPYFHQGSHNKGIAFGLNHVMKVRDGEALGGRGPSLEQAFRGLQPQADANGFVQVPANDPVIAAWTV